MQLISAAVARYPISSEAITRSKDLEERARSTMDTLMNQCLQNHITFVLKLLMRETIQFKRENTKKSTQKIIITISISGG